jgi:hypothetical protein
VNLTAGVKAADTHKIKSSQAADSVELCKTTALVDEESIGDRYILFNSNTFRDKERAKKAYAILQGLRPDEASRLKELEELLRQRGALLDTEVEHILGSRLYTGLARAGHFDRMQVNNPASQWGTSRFRTRSSDTAGRSKRTQWTMRRRCWRR